MYHKRNSSDSNGQQPENDFATRAPVNLASERWRRDQGVGEKFAANPVTGSGSMSVPLPICAGTRRLRATTLALL